MAAVIRVKLNYMAGLRAVTGKAQETVTLEGRNLGSLLDRLVSVYGEPFRRVTVPDTSGEWACLVAIGGSVVSPSAREHPVQDGDQVTLLPAMAGGGQ